MAGLLACTKEVEVGALEVGDDPTTDLAVTVTFVFENGIEHPYFGESDIAVACDINDAVIQKALTGKENDVAHRITPEPRDASPESHQTAMVHCKENANHDGVDGVESKSSFGSSGERDDSLMEKSDHHDIQTAFDAPSDAEESTNPMEHPPLLEDEKALGRPMPPQQGLAHAPNFTTSTQNDILQPPADKIVESGDGFPQAYLPDRIWIKRSENISVLRKWASQEAEPSSSSGEEIVPDINDISANQYEPGVKFSEEVDEILPADDTARTTRKATIPEQPLVPETNLDRKNSMPHMVRKATSCFTEQEMEISTDRPRSPDRSGGRAYGDTEATGCTPLRASSIRGAFSSIRRTLSWQRRNSHCEAQESFKRSGGSGSSTASGDEPPPDASSPDTPLPEVSTNGNEFLRKSSSGLTRKTSRIAARVKRLFSRERAGVEHAN